MEWYNNHQNLELVAMFLDETTCFKDWIYFLGKPWKWTDEYNLAKALSDERIDFSTIESWEIKSTPQNPVLAVVEFYDDNDTTLYIPLPQGN